MFAGFVMKSTRTTVAGSTLVAVTLAAVMAVPGVGAQGSAAGGLFDRYFRAETPADVSAAAEAIVAARVSFDEAWARLEQGRTYSADVAKGIVRGTRVSERGEFPYTLDIPQTYDPSRRYQVRVQLHGGITRPDPAVRGSGGIGNLAGADQIYVLPVSWRDAPWWGEAQLVNLRAILETVKRTYNVDENRVAVAGVSDGGTGVFYVAMRDTTPYASFLPLNGFIMILGQPSVDLRDPLFPNNLRNKPFFVVNGGRDQLYPTSLVDPYLEHLRSGGVDITYRPQPEGEHNTAWWPQVRDEFEGFVASHPREPHPVRLTWQAPFGPPSPSAIAAPLVNRAHWVVVNEVAPPAPLTPLPDVNNRSLGAEPNFGVRATGMRITEVLAGSNAAAMGILPNDIVRSINGRALPPGVPLLDILSIEQPGSPLTLVVARAGVDDVVELELSGTYQPTMMERTSALFPRRGPAGRVDAERDGNTIRLTTRGVVALTLLLSPDVFDFDRPIVVIADDREVFNGRVERNLETLMRWAARDNDRTMLYGAEVGVRLQ